MFHGHRLRILLPAVLALSALALPASSLAAGSPLHVDPSSPVAKAYALPIGNARGTASSGRGSGALFGSGIARTGTPDSAAGPGRARAGAPHVTIAKRARRPGPAMQGNEAHAIPAAYRVLRPGAGSGLLWMVLVAMVVIVCGGAGALALRRRR